MSGFTSPAGNLAYQQVSQQWVKPAGCDFELACSLSARACERMQGPAGCRHTPLGSLLAWTSEASWRSTASMRPLVNDLHAACGHCPARNPGHCPSKQPVGHGQRASGLRLPPARITQAWAIVGSCALKQHLRAMAPGSLQAWCRGRPPLLPLGRAHPFQRAPTGVRALTAVS